MAEVVPDPPGLTPRMDWSPYADGQAWRLTRGTDFDAGQTPTRARASFCQWAHRRGLGTRTTVVDEDTLIVKALERRGAAEPVD